MNTDQQTPKQFVAWLRSKAKRFNEMADEIEGEFIGPKPANTNGTGPELPSLGVVTAQMLRGYLMGRSARVASLAAHFNVTESAIRDIVDDPSSGFIIAERGWIKSSTETVMPRND